MERPINNITRRGFLSAVLATTLASCGGEKHVQTNQSGAGESPALPVGQTPTEIPPVAEPVANVCDYVKGNPAWEQNLAQAIEIMEKHGYTKITPVCDTTPGTEVYNAVDPNGKPVVIVFTGLAPGSENVDNIYKMACVGPTVPDALKGGSLRYPLR